MPFNRREWIKVTSAFLALLPIVDPVGAEAAETDRVQREATWEEIVAFFDKLPSVAKGWQGQSRYVRQYFILRIPFVEEGVLKSEKLAGKFVRSRYDHRGELLWYCLYLDEDIASAAPWTARTGRKH
jgi:hypothetical protein